MQQSRTQLSIYDQTKAIFAFPKTKKKQKAKSIIEASLDIIHRGYHLNPKPASTTPCSQQDRIHPYFSFRSQFKQYPQ